jgi:hypothetical protein
MFVDRTVRDPKIMKMVCVLPKKNLVRIPTSPEHTSEDALRLQNLECYSDP